MWGTKTIERLRAQWFKEREELRDQISQLTHRLLDAESRVGQKDQELREMSRSLVQELAEREKNWKRELSKLIQQSASANQQWKTDMASLRERQRRQVDELARQLEVSQRLLEEREAAWKVERIELARRWHAEREQSPRAAQEVGGSSIHAAVQAASLQWDVEKTFLEGKISWLTDQWKTAQQESEGRAKEFVIEFERMTMEVKVAAQHREDQRKQEYEELVGGLRTRCDQAESETHRLALEREILKNQLEQRERSIDAYSLRSDAAEQSVRQRWDQERRSSQEAMEEKDREWRAHGERLETELGAWKLAWEKREQEILSQLNELHRAYRAAEAQWHQKAVEFQAASTERARSQTSDYREQSRAFRDRVASENHDLDAIAQEVEIGVAGRLEKDGALKEPEQKLKVFRETREYIDSMMVEYVAKEGQSWEDRSAVETAIVKALETGRFALLTAQIHLRGVLLLR